MTTPPRPEGSENSELPARRGDNPEPAAPPSQGGREQLLLFQGALETATSKVWSGPVPDPETLEQYKATDASFPGILISEFRENGKHRRKCEWLDVATESVMKIGGLLVAAGLSFYALYSGTQLIQSGKNISGLVYVIGAMAGLVGVFIVGKRATREEPTTVVVAEDDVMTTTEETSIGLMGGAVGRPKSPGRSRPKGD